MSEGKTVSTDKMWLGNVTAPKTFSCIFTQSLLSCSKSISKSLSSLRRNYMQNVEDLCSV